MGLVPSSVVHGWLMFPLNAMTNRDTTVHKMEVAARIYAGRIRGPDEYDRWTMNSAVETLLRPIEMM